MKKRKKIIVILAILFFFLLARQKQTQALTDSALQIEKEQYQLEETINLTLDINALNCAAMDVSLYYDASKLEYIEGPKDVNVLENEIKFTWYDEMGGVKEHNIPNVTFEFIAKKEGRATISLKGNFYDSALKEMVIPTQNVIMEIGEEQNNEKQEVITQEEGIKQEGDSSNAKLLALRISEEGLSPYFSPEEKEYTFITDKKINSLEITAIPQNSEATVHVKGNENFILGKNLITIEVISQDKTQKEEYTIEVIKTNQLEKSNVNLETLAIEGTILYPSYDNQVNQYTAEVANNVENLNLLAIPENSKAQVKVEGKDGLIIGDNIVTITILGEDGITDREITVNVHRRTEEEQVSYEENQKVEAERLQTIMEKEKGEEKDVQTQQVEKKEQSTWILFLLILLFVIFLTLGVVIYDRQKKRKEEKK